ncbi:hypothetical protein F2P56_004325 [Juglans regia]|uniref:Myb/SANT-like domain-containing protein n=2 Tax=Juglans regia TaxID=51240 RepID=A0A834D603_JUGRE|nr:uncharacterized protein LOC109002873 [Juglans regia]KAF5477708.1 hypothetical protein F2P56_004325 [Juglans regia]
MEEVEIQRDHDLWSKGLEDIFIDMVYEEIINGTLKGGKITNKDHMRLAKRITAVGMKVIDSAQVKAKLVCLKAKQQLFTDLMGQTGMGWNPKTNTMIGSTENWANALKVNPSFQQFKTHGCRKYDILCTIFGQAVATGILHHASTQEQPTSDNELPTSDEEPPISDEEQHLQELSIDVDDMDMSFRSGRPSSSTSARNSHRRQRAGTSMQLPPVISECLDAITSCAAVRANLDELLYEKMKGKRSKVEMSCKSAVGFDRHSRCIRLLDEITPPLTAEQYNLASKRLLDRVVQNGFLALSESRRSQWVWSLH